MKISLRIAVAAIFAIFTIFLPIKLYSQSDANLSGHVVDIETGEHLPYFVIKLLGTSIVTMTDASGHYSLTNLKPGNYTVEASSVGFTTKTLKTKVEPHSNTELNFIVEPDALMLDQVVVTGSKTELKRRNSPALVSIVNDKIFGLVNASSLADGLNFQPGVRVENDCQNCGFTQVRINGLDGHYSQILMNSRPIFSALAGVYGLEHIPANIIDRVEVMRGGGSALFGSSAIGGTINIITKEPLTNYAEVAHSLVSQGITGSLDNNTTLNASVVGENNRMGITIYGQKRNRDGYDHDNDGYTEIAQIKTQTIGTRAYLKTTDETKLSVEYNATHEYRRGGDNLDLPPHEAMVAEQAEHNINSGQATFDLYNKSRSSHLNIFAAAMSTHRKSYYGSEKDPDAYGKTTDLTATAGAQFTHNFEKLWFMPAEMIGGLEYVYNRLHDISIGYDHDVLQKVNTYSAYFQNEWRDDRWGFLIGARLDKNSLIKNPIVSPRLNIRFNPSDKFNFRVSYSTGFRSPQAYDEDFHVAVVGGERVVTILNPKLKQESSHSVSASADIYQRFGNINTNLTIEGFFTTLNDVFALRKLNQPDQDGNTVLERYNGSGATVAGINAELRVYFPKWQIQAGITWQNSRYKKPEEWSENPDVPAVKRMFRTPDLYGFFTATYDITRKLKIAATGTYTGSMLVQHMEGSGTPKDIAVTTPRFFDANLKISYELKIMRTACLELNAGIANIFNAYQKDFDQGYLRDSGYIYGPTTPRSLTAGFKFHI